eukprot:6397963-Amphidinium_carterae.2
MVSKRSPGVNASSQSRATAPLRPVASFGSQGSVHGSVELTTQRFHGQHLCSTQICTLTVRIWFASCALWDTLQ